MPPTRGALALVGLLGLLAAAGAAADELIVANALGPSIAAYPRTAAGNAPPPRLIAGDATALSAPVGLALDPFHGEIAVVNAASQSLAVYLWTASGNAAPLRTLQGGDSGLVGPVAVAVDPFHGELVVTNGFGQSVTVHARTASGGAAPLRSLTGPSTGFAGPHGVALDLVHDELVVTNVTSQSVVVHARAAIGNATPLRIISGAVTGLAGPRGVAVDPVHEEIVVANIAGDSVTVYARRATGDAAPLRTLGGPATGLHLPVGVVVDTVNDELIVVDATVVRVFARSAAGDTPPLRIIAGPDTALVTPAAVAVAATPPLFAAVLPSSRSVQLGSPATAFAAIINAGPGPAAACGPVPSTPLDARFLFQTTDPVTNTPVGAPAEAANIPSGGLQTYVFAIDPAAPVPPTDVQFAFACAGASPALVTTGVNTLRLVASATPVPDIIAQSTTIGGLGIVDVPGPGESGAFGVATTNVGAAGTITVGASTPGVALPVDLYVCQTDPASGACLAPPAALVTLGIATGATPTFGIFAAARGLIPFDPAVNRVVVDFTEDGVSRGSTSVAIRTLSATAR